MTRTTLIRIALPSLYNASLCHDCVRSRTFPQKHEEIPYYHRWNQKQTFIPNSELHLGIFPCERTCCWSEAGNPLYRYVRWCEMSIHRLTYFYILGYLTITFIFRKVDHSSVMIILWQPLSRRDTSASSSSSYFAVFPSTACQSSKSLPPYDFHPMLLAEQRPLKKLGHNWPFRRELELKSSTA